MTPETRKEIIAHLREAMLLVPDSETYFALVARIKNLIDDVQNEEH